MLKVDLHTHILPETWPSWTRRSGYAGWIELEHHAPGCARMLRTEPGGGRKFFREVGANCWDPRVRLAEMDSAGVATQVLSTVPAMFSYWAKAQDAHDLARLLNDHVAGICRDASRAGDLPRFLGLCTLPMQDPALACRELERCVRELGLAGVQIGTNVNGANLDDPAIVEVLACAEQLNACVFVHPWDMVQFDSAGRDRMPRYWLPWLVGMPAETCIALCSVLFGGVLERLPLLRIGFAHGGGSFVGTVGRIEHGHACRPDLVAVNNPSPPSHALARADRPARFYVDSLVHDAGTLREAIRLFGVERVALGSDYPFPLGETAPGALIESMPELGEAERARLLRGTALEFLGMA